MLWRPTYETRVLRGIALPQLKARTLDGQDGATPTQGAALGAFGPFAAAELGVWRRLLEEAYPERTTPTVLVRPAWSARERRAVAAAVPPALHPWTLLADDPDEAWATAIAPDRVERAFGAVLREGVASLLMVGLPTEEAWDAFRGALENEF